MNTTVRPLLILALALLVAAPAAIAQTPPGSPGTPTASTLRVDEPLDVGGTILQPGVYTIRVVPGIADRNRVQVVSPDLQKVYVTVRTVPHPLEPNEAMPNTTFVYFPAGDGQPRALRTWFAPDPVLNGGHDIVYEESRARQLARLSREPVVLYTTEATIDAPQLQVVTPDDTIETYTLPAPTPIPEPAPVAEPTTPMTSAAPAQQESTTPMEMPDTAGAIPLVALAGLLSLGAAAALRARRRG